MHHRRISRGLAAPRDPGHGGVDRQDDVCRFEPARLLHAQVHRVRRTDIDGVRPGLQNGYGMFPGDFLEQESRLAVDTDRRGDDEWPFGRDETFREHFDG